MTDVVYELPNVLNRPMEVTCHVVERCEATPYLGQKVLELTNTALRRQFQAQVGSQGYYLSAKFHKRLPRAIVDEVFDPSDERLCIATARQIRTDISARSDHVPRRGVCTTVTFGHDLMALARITRRSQEETAGKRMTESGFDLQVQEVLAASPRRGLGSIALYTALALVKSMPGDRIIFDSLAGNGSNRWFRQIGFQSRYSEKVPDMPMGDYSLPRERLALDTESSKESLMARMIITKPWLAAARTTEY
jgi:hypothetical protein